MLLVNSAFAVRSNNNPLTLDAYQSTCLPLSQTLVVSIYMENEDL